ncbi:MAG: FecR domain-containing protein [Pseudomonadota bacterium]
MPDDDEEEDLEEMRRSEEAANIFRRLEENPDDLQAQKDRDAFLARGEAERATYKNLLRSLTVAKRLLKPKPKTNPNIIIFVVFALGAVLYLISGPVSIYLIADEITALEQRRIELASGDIVSLDGSSALIDRSDNDVRTVKLLKGAAYFEVFENNKPFVVDADGLTVTVVGTQFEVVRHDQEVTVSVSEGDVVVTIEGQDWDLSAGDRIRWSRGAIPVKDQRIIANIGSWREDLLVTDGMTFDEVIQTLDRRLSGPVIILSDNLAKKTFRGRLNLKTPLISLRALAATTGAQVRSAGPIATIVSER